VTRRADTPEGAAPPATTGRPGAPEPPRLSLGDPLDGRASEDRPESWGERGESESDRLDHYRAQTPPHHGA
jgi:hypothetical protein